MTSSAVAQHQRPVSPKYSGDTSTLHAMVKEIQDKVNAQGEIRYVVVSQNIIKRETVEDHYMVETHVAGDAASCTLQVKGPLDQV